MTAAPASGPEPGRRARLWRIAGIVAAVVVPIVTVATIVIPIVVDANQRVSSNDTLTTAVSAVELESEKWGGDLTPGAGFSVALPLDAPLEEFPLDPEHQEGLGCTQEQVDWLDAHRVVADGGSRLYDMRNAATAGGPITIDNVHVEGEFRPQDPGRFVFYCDGGGAGLEPDFVVLEVTLGDSSPAVVQYDYRSDAVIPAGTVFTMDLAPGELVQLYVDVKTLEPLQDFYGQIVADVTVDGKPTTMVLQEGWLWRSPPAIRQFEAQWTFRDSYDDWDGEGFGDPAAWHLMCVHQNFDPATDWTDWYASPLDGEYAECTPAQLAEQARSASREF